VIHGALAFVEAHPGWATLIAFVFTFIKSLALVSLLIPGTTILVAFGGVMGAAHIAFVPVWIAVSVAAALADTLSFWLGRGVQGRAHRVWPFTRMPHLLPRARRFIARWGALSVVLCRFFEPFRATVPLLCGAFGMSAVRFQAANWPSAFIWAAAVLGPGAALVRWLHS
jgi:membrane protein DedA with SNARE-associated domain